MNGKSDVNDQRIENLTKLNVENENISDINDSEYERGEHPN